MARTLTRDNVRSISQAADGPFLKVPPFPGSRRQEFARPSFAHRSALADAQADDLLKSVRSARVGSTYWSAQPELPAKPYLLVRLREPQRRAELLRRLPVAGEVVCWVDQAGDEAAVADVVSGPCDPWHLVTGASRVVADADDELALVAAIAGVPLTPVGSGRFEELGDTNATARVLHDYLHAFDYFSPYTGEPIGTAEAVALCSFWRRGIDSNRGLSAALGFAFWKRPTVAALLWAGSGDVPFVGTLGSATNGGRIAAWKSRSPRESLEQAQSQGAHLVEVEDGFIRSSGLGADCVAPLSIVVDPVGIHFDPSGPSKLEQILRDGGFSNELIDRARQLREVIVEAGLSKYGSGRAVPRPRSSERRQILVPGQVEDDRAVIAGGCGLTSNLELLRRVRGTAPDAHIVYKPHPDVEAGHRRGGMSDETALAFADEIVRAEPISALLDRVDEVHVNSSLAGFEALLRGKAVTTYGVPFYAGWGLTTDLGPVPERRTARRSLDELVAAALLLYPRYLDPKTGLPCPPEVLVQRLSTAAASNGGPIVRLRRMQGRCRRRVTALRRLVTR